MRSFEIGTYQFHRLFVDTNQNFRWDKPEHAPPADEKIFSFSFKNLKNLMQLFG